ncbi:exosome complex exonuclease RRP43 [Xylaria sp. CBS 124048]|nr:exosome complex exonuclease RRP43 [Xylaria sp. CBS 124048]
MATKSSLTLSSATFAKLSPQPYLLANLQPQDPNTPPSRTNGRQPEQTRPVAINTSSLTHAHGSAVVRTGDTTVICGVRGETITALQIPNYRASISNTGALTTTNELRDYDLLVPNIELATGSAPDFLPGVPPTSLAQTLSTRIYSLLHTSSVLDVEDLRIYHQRSHEGGAGGSDDGDDGDEAMQDVDEQDEDLPAREVKAYWVLYIDILFISFDGNPFDAAWAAVLAALRDTKLPRAYWDADREMVLCSRRGAPVPLTVSGLPVAYTAAVFTAREGLKQSQNQKRGGDKGQFWTLADPDRFEESLCDEMMTVIVDRSGGKGNETKLLGISKSGGTIVGPEAIRKLVKAAEDRWLELKAVL